MPCPVGWSGHCRWTVLNNRLLIADDTGDELYELDPDGADSQGTRLRALPSGLTHPQGMTVLGGVSAHPGFQALTGYGSQMFGVLDSDGPAVIEIDPTDPSNTAGTFGTAVHTYPAATEVYGLVGAPGRAGSLNPWLDVATWAAGRAMHSMRLLPTWARPIARTQPTRQPLPTIPRFPTHGHGCDDEPLESRRHGLGT